MYFPVKIIFTDIENIFLENIITFDILCKEQAKIDQ